MDSIIVTHSYGSIDATWAAGKFKDEAAFITWGMAKFADKPFFAKMLKDTRETWLKGIWKQITEATGKKPSKGAE